MTDTVLAPTEAVSPAQTPSPDPVRDALIESRQRWRELVSLAADVAFETDETGRFVLLAPSTALGWEPGALIGQPSELLVADDRTGTTLNPFCSPSTLRRHRVWIRSFGGDLIRMSFSAIALHDAAGHFVGSRGIGIDITDHDALQAQISGRLFRGEVLDHILLKISNEQDSGGMMSAALWALIHALGAEGAAVIGRVSTHDPAAILHECGHGAFAILPAAAEELWQHLMEPSRTAGSGGRDVLVVGCPTRFGADTGLAVWRTFTKHAWDPDDTLLLRSTARVIRMILELAASAHESSLRGRTDALTGLINRRAFLEEVRRKLARLDQDCDSGTLLLLDLDSFRSINDLFGHAKGDQMLVHFADILMKLVRPTDSVGRFSGDEFAVWLSGADHLTAAERAEFICKTIPTEIRNLMPELQSGLGVSIGIATRCIGRHESIEDLTRRANTVLLEVKRAGRSHWRVAMADTN